ncbi:siderophore-interacting protein [Pseudonocardia hydrocarbonoxydans]|uniref:Siderophore-interacting protein n=1 Tax=Pseudonocardia hydrocarbonoxydans TaxID=76726 RepID=A0A4Y3WQW7_9PSEU|nr:siderophore-interacting protein [Pseudonocardia hydrocarbonoxydans]GEC20199.1 siderophore-interacting protein [Pseudonocardia hydrocarbonoxydans]
MYGRVEHVEQLTPHMVRVVLSGEGLRGFSAGEFTDHYVKLAFPPPGAPYPVPFDAAQVRATLPREQWPVSRTYTVRSWVDGRLTIDFVVHGDTGVAGPWAQAARPGDLLTLSGPGGAFVPDPGADWYLMAGDESALPAIAASLERVPAGAPVHVFLEADGPDDEVELSSPGELTLTWVHRKPDPSAPDLLLRAVAELEFPPGRVCAFVHGEAVATRALRRHLLGERHVPRADLSVSGYWRRTFTEDGWRSSKAEWNRAVEQDV